MHTYLNLQRCRVSSLLIEIQSCLQRDFLTFHWLLGRRISRIVHKVSSHQTCCLHQNTPISLKEHHQWSAQCECLHQTGNILPVFFCWNSALHPTHLKIFKVDTKRKLNVNLPRKNTLEFSFKLPTRIGFWRKENILSIDLILSTILWAIQWAPLMMEQSSVCSQSNGQWLSMS